MTKRYATSCIRVLVMVTVLTCASCGDQPVKQPAFESMVTRVRAKCAADLTGNPNIIEIIPAGERVEVLEDRGKFSYVKRPTNCFVSSGHLKK